MFYSTFNGVLEYDPIGVWFYACKIVYIDDTCAVLVPNVQNHIKIADVNMQP
jgi:hypothetical protein